MFALSNQSGMAAASTVGNREFAAIQDAQGAAVGSLKGYNSAARLGQAEAQVNALNTSLTAIDSGISEIILVGIVPSVDKIHVGILIPESFHTITSVSDFVSHALVEYEYNTEYKDNYAFIDIAHRDSLKERDVVLRVFFAELKRLKIYVEDEEDDELVNYLEE